MSTEPRPRCSRRDLLKQLGAGAAAGAAAAVLGPWGGVRLARATPEVARQPNILLIVTDQARYPWHLRRGLLPQMLPAQRLLEDWGAVSFHQHMATSPICSPSRASIYTGLYPSQAGVTANMVARRFDGSIQGCLDDCLDTIGTVLQNAGYRTGYRGKWHLNVLPTRAGLAARGFDDWELLLGDYNNGTKHDEDIAEKACEWLSDRYAETNGDPWFLAVNFVNPHDIVVARNIDEEIMRGRRMVPWAEAPATWNAGRDKPYPMHNPDFFAVAEEAMAIFHPDGKPLSEWGAQDWPYYVSTYVRLMQRVDLQARRLLAHLFSLDAHWLDHTVVVTTSDHGDQGGAYGLPAKGPWMSKELLHVPLLIRFPGCEAPWVPRDIHRLSSHVDLLPTIAGFARAAVPDGLLGQDLRHVMANAGSAPPRYVIAQVSEKQAEVQCVVAETENGPRLKHTMTRNDCSQYPEAPEHEHELYELSGEDLDELENLDPAGTDPRTAELSELLADTPLEPTGCAVTVARELAPPSTVVAHQPGSARDSTS